MEHGLLIVAASLVAKHGLEGVQASVVTARGLTSCSSRALDTSSIAVVLSMWDLRGQTCVYCIGREILYH